MASQPQIKIQRVPYPTKGLVKSTPYSLLTPDTTKSALNARSFDQLEDRLRGGPRHGTSKWHHNLIESASYQIQNINASVSSGTEDSSTGLKPVAPSSSPPNVTLPPGAPWYPGKPSGGTWYVEPKKCSDGTGLGKVINWTNLDAFAPVIIYNGVSYFVKSDMPLVSSGTLLSASDPLLTSVNLASCAVASSLPTNPSCAVSQTTTPTYNHSGISCTSTFRPLMYANDTPLTFESFSGGEWYWHSEDPSYSPSNRPGLYIRKVSGSMYAWAVDFFGTTRWGGADYGGYGKDVTANLSCNPSTGNLSGSFTLYNLSNFCTGGDIGTLPLIVTL